MSTRPQLTEMETFVLRALREEALTAEEEGDPMAPVLDFWEGEADWQAACHLVKLGLVKVDCEEPGHLVLVESGAGSALLD